MSPADRSQAHQDVHPEFAQRTKRLVDFGLFRCRDPRIRHHPVGNEVALEQAFDETERLRAGEK